MSLFVELKAGYYTAVCSCGGKYLPMRLYRQRKKISTYCFYCKNNSLKHVAMEKLYWRFNENRNNKFNCEHFSVMKLHNSERNVKGALVDIELKGEEIGTAEIVSINTCGIEDITDFVAGIDAALSAATYKDYLREKHYKKLNINWNVQKLDYMQLKFIEKYKKAKK